MFVLFIVMLNAAATTSEHDVYMSKNIFSMRKISGLTISNESIIVCAQLVYLTIKLWSHRIYGLDLFTAHKRKYIS